MPTLLRSAHFIAVHHVASGYVSLARTTLPFATLEEAERELIECERVLRPVEAGQLGILLDWRQAPLSTDPRLHKIIVERSDMFIQNFARRALLTETSVGAMQSGRILRAQSATSPVQFLNEQDAVAHVCGLASIPPR